MGFATFNIITTTCLQQLREASLVQRRPSDKPMNPADVAE
jgi:hypothetical protein